MAQAAGRTQSAAIPTLHRERPDQDSLASAVAQLHNHGHSPSWSALYPHARTVGLPTYPFEHRRYWLAPTSTGDACGLGLDRAEHPLLGAVAALADQGQVMVSGRLAPNTLGWLAGHQVNDTIVFPPAGFIEVILRAGELSGCPAIDELIPARARGWTDLAINGSWWVGTAVGAALTVVLTNPAILPPDVGWRLSFGMGAILGLAVLFVRRHVPESPRWLLTHGRGDEAEAIVASSGLAWTIFRPSVIFGREDSFLNLFAKLERMLPVLPLGSSGARFQPVFVGDVARAFEAVTDDDAALRQRYNLCGPQVYTLRELVAYVGELTGYKRPILPLGRGLSQLQARVLEWLPGPLMSRDNLASMERDNVCDGSGSSHFGFPPTALEAVAPGYLAASAIKSRYDEFRAQSGR